MQVMAGVIGAALVVAVLTDLVNTLVTTQTARGRWWLTSRVYAVAWQLVRLIASAMRAGRRRELLLATFAPVSVLALLIVWLVHQIVGFGLIFWALGSVEGVESLLDGVYFSGVVYFTLGFGEIVPVGGMARMIALFEAFSGVLTTALVIGYLPALYAAYSERERKLMTIDDGSEDRITPIGLFLARSPHDDPTRAFGYFATWEEWIAGVIETHSTFPMLGLARSKDPGQHWITALGLICDSALIYQMIPQTRNQAPYWMLRRAIRLFDQLTEGRNLSAYRTRLDAGYAETDDLFRDLYQRLVDHGYTMLPYDEARRETRRLRSRYDAALEFLIDDLLAPRGFWGHAIGLPHAAGDEAGV